MKPKIGALLPGVIGICIGCQLVAAAASTNAYQQIDSTNQSIQPTASANKQSEVISVGIFDYIDQSLLLLFRFHQLFLSDIDGPNCPMYPTCSNYAIQSVQQSGFLEGSLKAIDRLHRCGHDLKYYPIIDNLGRTAHEDPP